MSLVNTKHLQCQFVIALDKLSDAASAWEIIAYNFCVYVFNAKLALPFKTKTDYECSSRPVSGSLFSHVAAALTVMASEQDDSNMYQLKRTLLRDS